MRVLVAGLGAIGSAVAGFIAKGTEELVTLGRKAHVEAINREGLHIHGIWGNRVVKELKAYTSATEITGKFDIIIISTKSFDTRNMVKTVKKFAHARTLFFSFQNGVVNSEIIAKIAGAENCVPCRVIFGARIPHPGKVEITVYGGEIICGPFLKEKAPTWAIKSIKKFVAILNKSKIPARYEENVFPFLWEKMLYNCALNPLSALFNVNYGKVFDNSHTREIMKNVIKEIFEILPFTGTTLKWKTHQEYWNYFCETLIPPTRFHTASMAVDLRKRGKTEIDALNGYISKKGEEFGVPTPFNTVLTLMIKYAEKETGGSDED